MLMKIYFLAYDDSLNIRFHGDKRKPFQYPDDKRSSDQHQRFVSYIKRKPKLIFKNLIGPLNLFQYVIYNTENRRNRSIRTALKNKQQ